MTTTERLVAYDTLIDPLAERAARDPRETALVFIADDGTAETVTTGMLWNEARAWARTLVAAGVGPQDVVVLVMGHTRALVPVFFGAMTAGAVPTIYSYPSERVAPRVYAERVRAVVAASGARAVVTTPEFEPALTSLLGGDTRIVVTSSLPPPEAGGPLPERPAAEAIAFLQFTSGSTGTPRGVAHTHRRALDYVRSEAARHHYQLDDLVVSWLPLYHDMGLLSTLITPFVAGVPTVLMSPFRWVRDPKVLLWGMHDYHGTITFVPNFALNHSVAAIRERDLEGLDMSRWRIVGLGGEPVSAESMRLFAERFGRYGFRSDAFIAGYGMAEAVEAVAVTAFGAPPRVDWVDTRVLHDRHRAVPVAPETAGATAVVSCGPPMRGAAIAIVDGGGRRLPEREVGEVIVRCSFMFEGYYRRPDLTAQAVRDGWLHPGDLGYLVDGELYVCGRTKDLIIIGGRNLYPEDLETIASGVDGVRPGRVVAFGVPDERLGSERVVVVCEGTDGLDAAAIGAIERELRRRTTQTLDVALSDVCVVERGWIIKTSNGKLARSANRARYLAELDPRRPRP